MREENDFDYADFSDLIGLIYDAAQDPGVWPELLEETGKYFSLDPDSASQIGEEVLESHFSRAIDLNKKISKLNTKNHTSNQILNRLPIGVIVVNEHAKNLAMNERALTVLEHGETLCSRHGLIQANSLQQTKELQTLIHAYASGNFIDKGASLLIRCDEASDTSLWITSSDDLIEGIAGHSNVAIIYIASSLIQPEFDVQTMQDNFGLTIAEARLVKALVNGCHNLNDAAEKLGVSIHTVRTHIKRTFEKTGTSNQMELVKKVLTSPSALFGKAQIPRLTSTNQRIEKKPGLEGCQYMRLYDGRRLSYAEYGDPEGKPVFLFHGLFGSRLQYPAGETIAAELGLRLIVPDRPGHGYSDLKKDRSLLDWPDDLIQLADHLELEKFSVLSYVAGGSYALACAYKIPERIEKLVIVSGRGSTVDGEYEGLSRDRFFLAMARKAPALFRQFMKITTAGLFKDPIKGLELRYHELCQEDRQLITSDQTNREMYAAALIESLRQGSEGPAYDVIAMVKPWEFSTGDIAMHIRFWHGVEDRQFPLHTAQQLVDELPHCDATFVPNIGSMLIIKHWDEILTDLAEGL